ncbi:MAG: phenylalanine--tRNA ligase subunit beta, partial [Candidatus Bathyarchaeota archaeon]
VEDVIDLLKKARYDAYAFNSKSISVKVPCYRVDIMHSIDVIEDVAIMYGYNNIKPRWPQLVTFGDINSLELFSDSAREIMIGFGFQETLSFSMSNLKNLFSKMNLEEEKAVEIMNPMSERFACLRSWLLPSLMEFLSNNTHVDYPQKIFEVGECTVFDQASRTGINNLKKLACLSIHSTASFSEIKAVLDALLLSYGITCDLKGASHGTFIEGRMGVASVSGREIGFVGEINPEVLEKWKLENPVAGFEVNLSELSILSASSKG